MDEQVFKKLALTILEHDWEEASSFQYDKYVISQFEGTAFDSDYRCYKVQWNDRSIVVKISTEHELQLLKELSVKGYRVPLYMASIHLQNEDIMIFMHMMPGTELYSVTQHEPWTCTAKEIAKIHKDYWICNSAEENSMRFPTSPRFKMVLRDAWYKASSKSSWKKYMEKIINRIAVAPKTFIHGDMFPTNVLVHNDGIGFVDFADAGFAPYMMDIGRLTGVIDKDSLQTMCPCPEKTIDAYYHEIRQNIALDYEEYLADIRMAQFLELAYIYCPPDNGLYLRDFKIKVEQQLYQLASAV